MKTNRCLLAAMTGVILMTHLSAPFRAEDPVPPLPVMDLHTDILLRITDNGIDIGTEAPWAQCTLNNMEAGHVTEQVLAVWVDSNKLSGAEATQRAQLMIDNANTQFERYPDRIALARTMTEAEAIKASGRIAAFLWIEGAAPIADSLDVLRDFHRQGVVGMTLAWMNNLPWAGSSTDKTDASAGLAPFGEEVVREMERLKMIVDVSHVSDQTFFDTLKIAKKPVVCSHSGCRALSDHPRNISDEMLKALAQNGGVIGIVGYPGYLNKAWEKGWDQTVKDIAPAIDELGDTLKPGTPEYREARRLMIEAALPPEAVTPLATVLDHIEHAMRVAGPEHVALGSDFDGVWAFSVGLDRPSKWQSVAQGLRDRGWSEEAVAGVMGNNARRVFREVLDAK